MGVSIEKSLEWLISRKEHYEMDDNCQELAQALELAIETMRKYQNIEQIYQEWNEVNDCSYNQVMQEIGEVLKDGETSD